MTKYVSLLATTHTRLDRLLNKNFLALISMAICSFAIGTTEFVTAGLLPDLAKEFVISIPVAGWVTSAYAIGVGIGGPILTALTLHWSRKTVLSCLMLLFILGSVISALAPTFMVLIMGRVVTALCHGAFFGIGAVVVTHLVSEGKGASAIAMMFTGLTLANVLGVPLGTLLGQDFGWRFTFWVIAGLGSIGLTGLLLLIPKKLSMPITDLKQELAVFKHLQVWLALLITALGFSGLITSFTYIAPMMIHIAGFPAKDISKLVAIYGVGLVVGNILGGRAADRALLLTLYLFLALLAAILMAFAFLAHDQIASIIILFLLGVVGFGSVSPLQKYTLNTAKAAPTLVSTANIAAFNLGIALGVYLGGAAIDAGFGYTAPNWVGALLTTLGLACALLARKINSIQKSRFALK